MIAVLRTERIQTLDEMRAFRARPQLVAVEGLAGANS